MATLTDADIILISDLGALGTIADADLILTEDDTDNVLKQAVSTTVLKPSDIINDLTTGGATKVLSAEKGKTLQDTKAPIASPTFTGTVTLPKTTKIQDTSADHTYDLAVSELAANRIITLPLLTGADEFVFKDHIQVLANKTLTLPQINDTSSDHQYVTAVSELTGDRTVTLPLLTGNDEYVFKAHIQELTNKTLTSPKLNENVVLSATATELNATEGRLDGLEAQLVADESTDITSHARTEETGKGDNQDVSTAVVKGKLDYKQTGNTVTNIWDEDGNFAAVGNWTETAADALTVSDNMLVCTGDGSSAFVYARNGVSQPVQIADNYFSFGFIRVTNSDCLNLLIHYNGSTGGTDKLIQTIATPVINTWYEIKVRDTPPGDATGDLKLNIIHQYADAATANGKTMNLKRIITVNTAAYNTAETDTAILAQMFPYSDGTVSTGMQRIVSGSKNICPTIPNEWEKGNISTSTGLNISGDTRLRMKAYYPIIGGGTVTFSDSDASYKFIRVAFYDSNFNFINTKDSPGVETIPDNAVYYRSVLAENGLAVVMSPTDVLFILPQMENAGSSTDFETHEETARVIDGTWRRVPDDTADEITNEGDATRKIGVDSAVADTDFASLDNTTYTNVDAVITTAFSLAVAGTTALDGFTIPYDSSGIPLAEVAQANIDETASQGKYYYHTDKTIFIFTTPGLYADIAAARTGLATMTLDYKLATFTGALEKQYLNGLVTYPGGQISYMPWYEDGLIAVGTALTLAKECSNFYRVFFYDENGQSEVDPSDLTLTTSLQLDVTGSVSGNYYYIMMYKATENSAASLNTTRILKNLMAQVDGLTENATQVNKNIISIDRRVGVLEDIENAQRTVDGATYDTNDVDELLLVNYPLIGAVTSLTLTTSRVEILKELIIKDSSLNANTNNITIDTEDGATIDGGATLVMNVDGQSVRLIPDGVDWHIIG